MGSALRFRSRAPDATRSAARALAAAIDERGLVLGLVGELGTGKTVFVKGLADGLGVDPELVGSPTFTIVHEYPVAGAGDRRMAHVDLYRLESQAELEAVGFLDLLTDGAVVAIEWADRLPAALPAERLELRLTRGEEPEVRGFEVFAPGPDSARVLARWRARLADLHEIELRPEGAESPWP